MNSANEISLGIEHQDFVFKFVIIGDSGVGKTGVIRHLIFNKFKKETTQTIGVEFSSKIIKVGNRDIKLQIWDTAGQEKFRSVARSYYRAAIGVIIIYDITKPETFQHVPIWLNDAKNAARIECSICVVGNKSDLKDSRVIKYNDGAKFCQENNLIHFECSAYSGYNVDEIFTCLTKHIINKIYSGIIDTDSVISSYANIFKNVNANKDKEEKKKEEWKCSNAC